MESFDPALGQVAEANETPALPSGFSEKEIVSGLARPTAMEFAPDGRLFVAEQGGNIRVIENGVLLEEPFLRVNTIGRGKGGLLGITFDPEFEANGYVYVYYTAGGTPDPIHARVSRFTTNNADPNTADPESETIIIEPEGSVVPAHMAGAIGFGNDGKLYIATGDQQISGNSQNTTNLLGKILRYNPDGSIPDGNPPSFITANGTETTTGRNRAIYVMGLRNPYRFAFDALTGRMFVNDVGESDWEEVNDVFNGSNYGWPICEGSCQDDRFVDPIYAYSHGINIIGTAMSAAITGGAFYRGATFPEKFYGKYVFSDFSQGWIKWLDPATGEVFEFGPNHFNYPVDLKIGPDGGLYVLSYLGMVLRFQYDDNLVNEPTATPKPLQTETPTALPTVAVFPTAIETETKTNISTPQRQEATAKVLAATVNKQKTPTFTLPETGKKFGENGDDGMEKLAALGLAGSAGLGVFALGLSRLREPKRKSNNR